MWGRVWIMDITAKKAPRGAFGYNIYIVNARCFDNKYIVNAAEKDVLKI